MLDFLHCQHAEAEIDELRYDKIMYIWFVIWYSGNAVISINKVAYMSPSEYLDGRLSVCR